jgi:cytidylate kinase
VRVLLIGGTSNVGKSTVAEVLAARLGFEHRSTDYLARHPGRPWRTHEREVPPHVAEHYSTLSVDELIATHPGLVLEGSALWPVRVATLSLPDTAAVWLTADDTTIRDRVHASGDYDTATADERALMDKFVARSQRFQELILADIEKLGLTSIDVKGRCAAELADTITGTV